MKIERITVGPMQVNCYILWEDIETDKDSSQPLQKKKAYVTDPGDEPEKISGKLQELGLECQAILLTHGHFDHITGVKGLKELTGAPVYAGEAEDRLLKDADLNVSKRIRRPVTVEADRLLKDGEIVEEAGMHFKTIFTPGHTSGSVCYYFEKEGVILTGDTLFQASYGRTDFPTGNEAALFSSITHRLLSLPENTICYPGHGEATDIASESRYFRD